MMDEEDIKEYHNIGKAIKHSDKYRYMSGQMYEHHGTRMYDFNGDRLPSVTTILGLTKDQSFIKEWQQKVGHAKAESIKNHSSKRGTSMHKFLESHITELVMMTYHPLGRKLNRWQKRLLRLVLHPLMNIMVRKLRYITRAYTQALQILSAHTMAWKLLLTSSRPIVRRRKNGSKTITFKSQRTPWHTTTSTTLKLKKELSWYARLTYIIKSSRSKGLI